MNNKTQSMLWACYNFKEALQIFNLRPFSKSHSHLNLSFARKIWLKYSGMFSTLENVRVWRLWCGHKSRIVLVSGCQGIMGAVVTVQERLSSSLVRRTALKQICVIWLWTVLSNGSLKHRAGPQNYILVGQSHAPARIVCAHYGLDGSSLQCTLPEARS